MVDALEYCVSDSRTFMRLLRRAKALLAKTDGEGMNAVDICLRRNDIRGKNLKTFLWMPNQIGDEETKYGMTADFVRCFFVQYYQHGNFLWFGEHCGERS